MIVHYSLSQNPPVRFETESNSITFGRNPLPGQHVDINLTSDDYVSRVHAVVTYENGEYWLEDLNSANGTWINRVEMRAKKKRLKPGDEVQVGYTIIKIEMETEPAVSVADAHTVILDREETDPRVPEPLPTPDETTVRDEPLEDEPFIVSPDPGSETPDIAKEPAGEAVRDPDLDPVLDSPTLFDVELEVATPSAVRGARSDAPDAVIESDAAASRFPEPDLDDPTLMDVDLENLIPVPALEQEARKIPPIDSGIPPAPDETTVREESPEAATPAREPGPEPDMPGVFEPPEEIILRGLDPLPASHDDALFDADSETISPGESPEPKSRTVAFEEELATSVALIAGEDPAPDPEGTISDFANITERRLAAPDGVSADEMLDQAWRQLAAFNDLSQVMGTADTLDSLAKILIERLPKAIPNAQRGAVLLPDDRGKLLLKAHWPMGDHAVNMTWIKRAFDRREHFIWTAPDENLTEGEASHDAVFYLVQSAIYVPLLLGEQVMGVMYVDNNYTREAFSATDLALMRAIANQMAVFVRDYVLQENLSRKVEVQPGTFRQFSPGMAQRVFGENSRLRIGGERVNPVTILASNIHRFTDLTEKMKPRDVVEMLNEMLDAFVPIVFEFDGVVDKYIDDSLLAVFGSPEKDDRQWEKAVEAALEMQQAVRMIAGGRKVRKLPVFHIGISVHTGEAIHGLIGSPERTEYTVFGETVNSAFMYCDAAGPGEVIISKAVYERVYHFVEVELKTTGSMHPGMEPDHAVYVVKGLKKTQ